MKFKKSSLKVQPSFPEHRCRKPSALWAQSAETEHSLFTAELSYRDWHISVLDTENTVLLSVIFTNYNRFSTFMYLESREVMETTKSL